MSNLFLEQDGLTNRILIAFEKFSKNPDKTIAACKVRMKRLEKNFQKFEINHDTMIAQREYPRQLVIYILLKIFLISQKKIFCKNLVNFRFFQI